MELLFSNLLPLKTSNKSFADQFEYLLKKCTHLKIATGYISTESVTELKKIIEINGKPELEILVGMHYFDGITKPQYDALCYLDDFLKLKGMKGVMISSVLKFHGKLYSFKSNRNYSGAIIGSSNLNSIFEFHRNYEADVFFHDPESAEKIDSFIQKTFDSLSTPFSDWHPKSFIVSNPLLQEIINVEKVNDAEVKNLFSKKTPISFNIPLKSSEDASKSNLNAYFGKGRENKNTGYTKPRHWYEVELIVPSVILNSPDFPKKDNIFKVITDDGWSFNCRTSGAKSKNLRSDDDLTILGKWLKGRLENHNVLKVGELVTDAVLEGYGRNNIQLTKTTEENTWLLDFSLPN